MYINISNINQEKQNIINRLINLKEKILKIEKDFNIELSSVVSKIDTVIDNITNNIFSIAFFGAFSDGKSSILSVLIDRTDIEISPEPTTNKIQCYKFKDYQIVDTPGLFSENLIHDKKTKKYISEANIIIYTLDPVNPLKESHLNTVKWILSDLKKVDSTIFVINKMDEIADLEDEEDFNLNATIKKKVVYNTIKELLGEDINIKIVCVAADPFGLGLEYWRKNKEEYKQLSRITDLESLILELINKYKDELILRSGISVIQDSTIRISSELENIKSILNKEIELLRNQIKEYNSRIKILEKDITQSYTNIKEDLISLRENILVEFDSASNLNSVCQKMLGKDGYLLQEQIDLIIKKHTGTLIDESKNIFESLDNSLTYHAQIQDKFIEQLSVTGKSLIKGMLNVPTRKLADTVLTIRDSLNIPFKFEPWGAVKLAKCLQTMPILMDILQLGGGIWSKIKQDKKRTEIKNQVEELFKNLFKQMTTENYIKTYFPYIEKNREILQSLEDSKKELENMILKTEQLKIEIKSIINIGTVHSFV